MQMQITIDLNNDAMRNREEVARVIRQAAEKYLSLPRGGDFGKLRDINGNTVGCFSLYDETAGDGFEIPGDEVDEFGNPMR